MNKIIVYLKEIDLDLYPVKNYEILKLLTHKEIYIGNCEKIPTLREKLHILDRRIDYFIKKGICQDKIIKILTK